MRRDLTALAVLSASMVGAFVWMREAPSRAGATAPEDAWGLLARCLVGGPLGDGEQPSLRMRHIELATLAREREKPPGERWPRRCGAPARALHDALAFGSRAEREVADLAHAVGEIVEEGDRAAPELEDGTVDALFDLARERGLAEGRDHDALAVKALPLTEDDFGDATRLTDAPLDAISTDRVPAGALRLLVGDAICEVSATGPAACAALPASVGEDARDVRLLGSAEDGATSLVFLGAAGERGIVRADTGERVEAFASYGAFARRDGFYAALGWDKPNKEFKLTRVRPGHAKAELGYAMRTILFENMIALLWDHIFYAESGTLSVDRVMDGDVATTPTRTIGPLPRIVGDGHALHGCKSRGALFVVVRAPDVDRVAVGRGDVWRGPWAASGTGGEIACDDDAVWLTRRAFAIEDGALVGTLSQERCGDDACVSKDVRLDAMFGDAPDARPARDRDLVAATLDGKLLVVWRSPRGGVRARLAPIGAIDAADDVVVFDDLVSDGSFARESTVLGMRLFVRPGFAALAVATRRGVHLVRVGGDGAVAPVDVSHAR